MKIVNWVLILFIVLLKLTTSTANAAESNPLKGTCEVVICNKLERATFSLTYMIRDSMGEACFPARIGKEHAIAGKELSSESRWYQGSFNPTKASVTRVREVIRGS